MTAECLSCGLEKPIKARKMCDACYMRQYIAEHPDYYERQKAHHREYQRQKRANDPEWAEEIRLRDRIRGAKARGDQTPNGPRRRTDVPCVVCGTTPCYANYMCLRCYKREYQRRYRRANPRVRERELARNDASTERNYRLIAEVKTNPCVDCGGRFPQCVMDFDHIPERGPKLFKISGAATRSVAALMGEIAKCDLVCVNCHRIRSRARAKALGRNGMY
jgi:hypothetical protein